MAYDPLLIVPGTLRHQIQVQSLSTASGNQWEGTPTLWTPFCSTMAAIDEIGAFSPKTVLAANVLSEVSTHLITVRWTNDSSLIIPGNRIMMVSNGKLFYVQIVINVLERNRVLRIYAQDLQTNVTG